MQINRVLREENKILKENNALFRELMHSKDSSLNDCHTQVSALMIIHDNNTQVIRNKDAEIGLVNERLEHSLKQVRQQRRQKNFVIFTGIVATAAAIWISR